MHWISPQGNRVSVTYADSVTGKKLARDEINAGVEVSRHQYASFTAEEVKAIAGKKENVVEIHEIIPRFTLPPAQVEKTHYLEPSAAPKGYIALHVALSRTKRVAVGKWYTRGRDYLVVLQPDEEKLVMVQMYYMSEVRSLKLTFDAKMRPSAEEIQLTIKLLDSKSQPRFTPESYQDEHAARVKAAIALKQAAQPSLATLLKKSLKGANDEGGAKERKGRAGGRRR